MSFSNPNQYPADPPSPESETGPSGLPLPLGKLLWTYILLGLIVVIFIVEQMLPSFIGLLLPYLPPEYIGLTPTEYIRLTPTDFRGGSTNSLVLILLGGNFHPLVEEGQVWRSGAFSPRCFCTLAFNTSFLTSMPFSSSAEKWNGSTAEPGSL